MRKLKNTQTKAAMDTGQFLFLSLFLLLLAFFIALTAGAEFDDNKTDPILNGLKKVFPVSDFRGVSTPADIEGIITGQNEGQALDNAEAFFTADIFPFATNSSRERGQLSITMRNRDLDETLGLAPEKFITQRERQQFFANLATLTQPEGLGRKGFAMIIEIPLPKQAALMVDDNARSFSDYVLMGERYLSAFKQAGLSADRIVLSFVKGRADYTRLAFVSYDTFIEER